MKRERGYFVRLAALATACLLLAGCVPMQRNLLSPNNPVHLRVWHYYNGAQKQAFDEMVTEFNETEGAQRGIVVDSVGQGNMDDLKKSVFDCVEGRVGAGEMPDIFSAYSEVAYTLYKQGVLADMGAYLNRNEKDQYISSYLYEAVEDQEHVLMFPVAKSTEVLLLNRTDWDAFAQDTGADIERFATWEGIAQLARDYYLWSDGKALFGRDAIANYLLVGAYQLGSEIFQVKDSQVTCVLDKAVLRKLWDNYYTPMILGYYGSEGKFRSDDVKTGAVVGFVGSTASAAYFPTNVTRADGSQYPIQVQALPMPVFEGSRPVAVQQGAGMVVTKSTEQRQYAAAVFLKWFTQDDMNMKFAVNAGYLPVKRTANDVDSVGRYMDSLNPEVPSALRQAMLVAVEMAGEYEFYAGRAFDEGVDARDVLTEAFSGKIDADLETVLQRVGRGEARQEVAESFLGDDNFESWVNDLRLRLETLAGAEHVEVR